MLIDSRKKQVAEAQKDLEETSLARNSHVSMEKGTVEQRMSEWNILIFNELLGNETMQPPELCDTNSIPQCIRLKTQSLHQRIS